LVGAVKGPERGGCARTSAPRDSTRAEIDAAKPRPRAPTHPRRWCDGTRPRRRCGSHRGPSTPAAVEVGGDRSFGGGRRSRPAAGRVRPTERRPGDPGKPFQGTGARRGARPNALLAASGIGCDIEVEWRSQRTAVRDDRDLCTNAAKTARNQWRRNRPPRIGQAARAPSRAPMIRVRRVMRALATSAG